MIALTPVSKPSIGAAEDSRLQAIAASLELQDGRFQAERDRYGPLIPDRLPPEPVPTLHVDDFSVIPHLQQIVSVEYYPSRAFVRGGDGDIVAGTFAEIPNYGNYLSRRLGLGRSTYVRATPHPEKPPYAVFAALLSDPQAQAALEKQIKQIAKTAGIARMEETDHSFWIHPYMGHADAWRFAELLARRTEIPIQVVAPPPAVTEQVNNKVWFSEVVGAVLGQQSVLESSAGRSIEGISTHLQRLASDGSRLALKLANGASGMGTGFFEAREVLSLSTPDLCRLVAVWLQEHEWKPGMLPISVERWEADTLGSPSIQLWIPPVAEGPPLLEGVFDQLFYPDQEHVFLGSRRSCLPAALVRRIGDAGVRIGRVFQYLGYLGRCSFDTILCGENVEAATIVFTECNGRWGGTSTPMTLMNRLFGDYRTQPYVVSLLHDPRLQGLSLDDLVRTLDDVLYNARDQRGWAIVLNVGCLEPAGKLDVITLGDSYESSAQRQDRLQEIVASRF